MNQYPQATIEADPDVPAFHLTRDFAGTVDQVFRAHTDPELFARWVGPTRLTTEIVTWDARDGGAWRYLSHEPGLETGFRGCFHTVTPERIVQTFAWEERPEEVSLQTMTLTDLGDGRTRLRATSLTDSFRTRDQWLASGMETGVNEGYAALDALLAEDAR